MRAVLVCFAWATVAYRNSDNVGAEGSRTINVNYTDDDPTSRPPDRHPEWRTVFPECEPERVTDECPTKTCSYSDFDWSGILECTCDTPKTPQPKRETILDVMRREWTENHRASNCSHNASSGEADLILLTDSKLWQVNPQTGRSKPLISLGVYYDAKDFAVWHSKKSVILAKSLSGVHMCSVSVNASDDLDFGCTCDDHCKGRNGTEHVLLDHNRLPSTFSVAVDWVHGLYYWAGHDYAIGAIGVYEIATKRRRVLFNGQSFEPLDIEVDPIAGYIFWVDDERNSVFRADADGRNMTAIINVIGIRSIALDVNARRIYFVDSIIRHLIASTDYFGEGVVTILQDCQFVSSLSPSLLILNDYVFWAEGNTLLSISKYGNGSLPKVHYVADENIQALHAWHHSVQPTGVDRCSDHRCEFMCLPRVAAESVVTGGNNTASDLPYSCACALGERSTWQDGKNDCVDADGGKRHGLAVPL